MEPIVLKILGAPSPNDFCHCGRRNRYDNEKSKRRDGRDLKKQRQRVRHPIEPGTGWHGDSDAVAVRVFGFPVSDVTSIRHVGWLDKGYLGSLDLL